MCIVIETVTALAYGSSVVVLKKNISISFTCLLHVHLTCVPFVHGSAALVRSAECDPNKLRSDLADRIARESPYSKHPSGTTGNHLLDEPPPWRLSQKQRPR